MGNSLLTCERVGASTARCGHCGEQFSYLRTRKPRKYCSQRCSRSADRTPKGRYQKTCEGCGTTFVAGIAHARFCCRGCYAKYRYANAPGYEFACVVCGDGFVSRQSMASCCSAECLRSLQSQLAKAAAPPPKYPPRSCERCGEQFHPNRPSGAQKRGEVGWGKFCSKKCSSSTGRPLDNARRRLLSVLASRRICPICAEIFVGRSNATFCSSACRAEHARRSSLSTYHAKQAQIIAIRPPKTCPECNKEFTPQHGGREFCSPKCAKRSNKRVRKALERSARGAAVERVNPFDVFRRDAWRCQLCGVKTLSKQRGTIHPRAPELDHIVPLSRGGAHTYRNTQCACRACNQKKSNGAGGQLRLFG